MDKRLIALAKNIVDNSLSLSKGDTIYINARGEEQFAIADLTQKYAKEKGIDVIFLKQSIEEYNNFWENATQDKVKNLIDKESIMMNACDGYITYRGGTPASLTEEQQNLYGKYFLAVHENIRLKKKWCVTSIPTVFEELETFLNSCSIDYSKFSDAMTALEKRMLNADKVKIIASGTDLEFSIKGLPAIKCVGKRNMPDGELYTAPIKESVNGFITYNIPSTKNGITFNDVYLKFKNGKIIDAKSNNDSNFDINKIFDIDPGARYVGEFSFGLNPFIKKPYNNTLYDEKINGSIHFTPGGCYERCNNGNNSVLHWDLVQIQTPEYGGGEIYFDNELIRKDGLFIKDGLKILNPNNLVKALEDEKVQ